MFSFCCLGVSRGLSPYQADKSVLILSREALSEGNSELSCVISRDILFNHDIT